MHTKTSMRIAGGALAAFAFAAVAHSQNGKDLLFLKLFQTVPAQPQMGHSFISGSSLAGYVGVGRTSKLTTSELLGLRGVGSSFNGMNIDGPGNSKQYYGYANNGVINAYTEFDGATGMWSSVVGGKYLGWDGTHLVVGAKNPAASLDVRNGNIAVTNASAARRVELFLGASSAAGIVETSGPGGLTTNYFGTSASSNNYGYLGVCDNTGLTQGLIFIDNLGRGNVVADIKNFRVTNPRNNAEDIYYASLEGPEAGAYMRGSAMLVNGKAHIDLPEHFQDVTVSQGETVQVTPNSELSEGLAVKNKSNKGFDVVELRGGKGNYEFDWEVKCVRAGHEDYRVVRPWVEALPGGTDLKASWTARLQSISQQRELAARKRSHP